MPIPFAAQIITRYTRIGQEIDVDWADSEKGMAGVRAYNFWGGLV